MKRFTQKDLLEEGFWDKFKGVAKGAVRATAQIARTVAPEITDPLDRLQNSITGVRDAYKQGREGVHDPNVNKPLTDTEVKAQVSQREEISEKLSKQIVDNIIRGLSSRKLTLVEGTPFVNAGIDRRGGGKIYKIIVTDGREKFYTIVNSRGLQPTV
jgi:hypothetical protein|tara:strand:+ start:3091 stop:3561 length:471 start_codon:yes stop_codon:yes gene_type:complete